MKSSHTFTWCCFLLVLTAIGKSTGEDGVSIQLNGPAEFIYCDNPQNPEEIELCSKCDQFPVGQPEEVDCSDGEMVAGQCLLVSTDKKEWGEAKRRCEEQNAELVSLADPEAFATYMREKYGTNDAKFWIGGTDSSSEGDWEWLNGESLGSGFPWANGEPNDAYPGEDCLQLKNGIFNDSKCNNDRQYVCEKKVSGVQSDQSTGGKTKKISGGRTSAKAAFTGR